MALRTPLSVTPHLYMGDSTGRPLDMGTVYFGEQDKDPEFYPINLFSDDELTKPLMQPVHTKGGYLYDKGDMVEPHAKEIIYSVKVLDSYGRKVFYKGAMMRNSWNDDVIQQIDQAIINSTAMAEQIASDAVQSAIEGVAIDANLVSDALIKTVPRAGGGVARNQQAINNTVFRVKDFGAVGNGVTDDRAAICAAITACSNAGGGEVVFDPTPLGYATTLGTVRDIYNVRINGNKQRLITLDPKITTNGSRAPFNIVRGGNIEVFGFDMEGGYETYTTSATRVNNHNLGGESIAGMKIYNNTFRNCGYPTSASTDEAGDSIYIIRDSYDIEIYDNIFINPSRWSVSAQYNTKSLNNFQIRNNLQIITRPNNCLGFVDLEFSSSLSTVYSDVVIADNIAYFACMISMTNASFSNVIIRDNIFRGYTFGSNRIYKDLTYPYGFGITLSPDAGRDPLKDITIINNTFDSVNKQNLEVLFPSENLIIEKNTILTQPDAPIGAGFSKGIIVKNALNARVKDNTVTSRFGTNVAMLTVTESSGSVSGNTVKALLSTSPCNFSSSGEKLQVFGNSMQTQNSTFQFDMNGNVEFYDNTTPDGTSGRINTTLAYYGRNNTALRAGDLAKVTRSFFAGSNASIYYASTIPAIGKGVKGDIVFNTSVAAGSPIGWVCTVAGVNETWLPFGVTQIAATYTATGSDARILTASTATVAEVANTLATLIKDLKSAKLLS